MGLWGVDDITSNILFRRKKIIWRNQITTAEIKKEGQEEEEKEEKEKERKKIQEVIYFLFQVQHGMSVKSSELKVHGCSGVCVHMHVWKYVCHCAYMGIRGCLGRHYMTQRVSHTASKTQCVY